MEQGGIKVGDGAVFGFAPTGNVDVVAGKIRHFCRDFGASGDTTVMAPISNPLSVAMLDEPTTVRILIRDRIKILSYIDSFLGDLQLAEDCFQDVCAAAVAREEPFENETHVLRWALRVGRNKSVDLARKRSREPVILDDDVLDSLEGQWSAAEPVPSDHQAECIRILRHCLDALTENSRRIVHLRYVDDMKSSRIAKALGRNVESIYRALTRAHVALRECMERNSQEPNTP
jgi:RNA polymerase sigma-70 factor (ECF subfamily)